TRMCGAGRPRGSRLSRLLHLRVLRTLVALTGATVTVTAVAYVLGPPVPDEDEAVAPPVEQFVAQFDAASASALRPVRAARTDDALGIEQVSETTDSARRGVDSPEAVRLLERVSGAKGGLTLHLLTQNFDLSVGHTATIDGRGAVEVVAGRDGRPAASYWIDADTGTLLRRVAYDRRGMPVAQSSPGPDELSAGAEAARPVGGVASASTAPISMSTLTSLSQSGWPCHEVLAGDLHRVESQWTDDQAERIVTLTYTDGVSTLSLFEQSGALDEDRLADFEPMKVSGSTVWVRRGSPMVATWDEGGVVYTAVTDAGRRRLAHAIEDLPRTPRPSGVVDRVGGGIQRLSAWVDPVGTA
ncbi:MAG: hypothetical protein ACRDO8_01705, partial [Nocardioidaceae bacterium]